MDAEVRRRAEEDWVTPMWHEGVTKSEVVSLVADAIAQAVTEEREACAKLAERYNAWADEGDRIAAAIRLRQRRD